MNKRIVMRMLKLEKQALKYETALSGLSHQSNEVSQLSRLAFKISSQARLVFASFSSGIIYYIQSLAAYHMYNSI